MFPTLVCYLSLFVAFILPSHAKQHGPQHVRRASNATESGSGSAGLYTNTTTAVVATTSSTSSWTDTVLFCSYVTQVNTTTSTCKNSCVATWNDYFSSQFAASWNNASSTTYETTYTYHNMTAQITTACDGHPRVVGDLTTTATGTNTTLTTVSVTGNFTKTTPSCSLAPSDCTSFYGLYGPSQISSYCTNTTGLNCGTCTINGGTVQLIYFPVTAPATTTQNLCPNGTISPGTPTLCPLGPTLKPFSESNPYDDPGCDYAMPNTTSTPETAPFVVSAGQTFYEDKVYISLETVVATDQCGYVGSNLPGTILTLQSSDIYTIGGYHHAFADVGYSFNYRDLTSVPSYAYYLACDSGGGDYCEYYGTKYTYGRDYINGVNTYDLGDAYQYNTSAELIADFAYAPTLLAPLQLRALQSAWADCALDLGGEYDPPKALTQALTEAGPSMTVGSSSSAAPASSATNTLATATALPESTTASTSAASQASSSQTQEQSSQPKSTSVQQSSASVGPGSTESQQESSQAAPTSAQAASTAAASTNDQASPAQSQNPQGTSTSQGIGGIVASVLGLSASSTAANAGGSVLSIFSAAETSILSAEGTTQAAQADPTSNDPTSDHATSGDPTAAGSAVATFTDQSGSTYTAVASSGGAVIGSVTVSAGQQTTVGGQAISVGSSAVVVGGSQTIVYSQAEGGSASATATEAVVTAGGSTFVASQLASGSGAVINGQTLSQGQVTTIGSQVLSIGTTAVIVDGTGVAPFSQVTQAVVSSQDAVTPQTVFTVNGATYSATALSSGGFIVGGSTILQGAQATISGHTFSAGSSDLVVDGSTALIPSATTAATGAIFTADGSTYTATEASSGAYIIDGSTISQGSQATISGHTFSAGSSGVVVDGTQTVQPSQLLPAVVSATAGAGTGAVFTIGSSTITAVAVPSSSGVVTFAGQTLSVGGSAITIDGTAISEGSSGIVLQGTSTVPLSGLSASPVSGTESGAVFTVGSSTFTAEALSGSSGVVTFAGHTISVGGSAVTVDGTVVSEGSAGLVLQGTGGTSTVSLSELSTTPATTSKASASSTQTAGTSSATTSKKSAGSQTISSLGSTTLILLAVACVYMARNVV